MAIQRINPDDIEVFTLTTNPPRTFVSNSLEGHVSGTLHIFPRRSTIEKETFPLSIFTGSYNDLNLDQIRETIVLSTGSNKLALLQSYLRNVNSQSYSLRKQQTVEVIRFEPSARFSSNTTRKGVVINQLMPYYRGTYPEAHFAFTNYHTLNFLTASSLPSDTAVIYADTGTDYSLSGAFSFDFWINPRYTNDYAGATFKAGTIFHRSSSYAISLMSGSGIDVNGQVNKFKLCLQLSHSAEVAPSLARSGSKPFDLVFFSNDNVLTRNTWHHVTIRWGTTGYNLGSGSFVVDGNTVGTFVIPSASLPEVHQDNCLFIGNFFQGPAVDYFFTTDVANRDGLTQLVADVGSAPPGMVLNHPLNAEVHELKIYNRYLSDTEVSGFGSSGPTSGSALMDDSLLFYLPPFYTPESPIRKYYGNTGGIIVSPFYTVTGSTSAPFGIEASFGSYGHYLNLENFVRDFATSRYGRLFNLTASVIATTAPVPTSFNDFLYATGSNRKRNLTLLPNDNGRFTPNFTFMIPEREDYIASERNGVITYYTGSATASFRSPLKVDSAQFINDLGNLDPGLVTLRNLITMSLFQTQAPQDDETLASATSASLARTMNGVSPENLGDLPSTSGRYTIFQRTGDNTSNQVVFFDISNLYYGMGILPGSLVITDNVFTGSDGKVTMTLKDDGEGNIFRASHSGSCPNWASVGNVFYNEGIVILKHPSLYFMGTDKFDISFQGVQNTHILTFNLFKRPLTTFSSSNPSYMPVSASDNANDTDGRFVYITNINLHDDNLNVITRTSLAQPIVARTGEKFLFKVKMDY